MSKREQIIKNRIIKKEYFDGKRFKPGISTRLGFLKLFTLVYPDFSKSLNIKSINRNMDHFMFLFEDKEGGEIFEFDIKDNNGTHDCSGKLCTKNLCFGIHYQISNERFLKFFVSFANKGGSIKFSYLMQIIVNDIKAKKEFYQIFWKQNRPPFSIIQNWGHPLQAFRFIVHEGVMRNMDQSINLNLPEGSIHHSERECKGISPGNKDNGYHFFNFPGFFYDHRFDKYYYLSQEEKDKYVNGSQIGQNLHIFTDLDENDIILGGGTEKLSEALDYAVENIEKNNIKMLSFNCCCVPRIIGDDIYSTLSRTKEKINVPFVFQGQLEKTPYEQKIELLEQYLDKIDSLKIPKIDKSISLFGFHENKYQKELGDILKNNGVKINTSFIPTIDVRLLELMYKSKLFVFSPNNFQREVFEYPFMGMGIDYISPSYPYGIQKSDDWLNSIGKKLGIDIVLGEENNKFKEEYEGNVNIIKKKGYKIGIFFIGKLEIDKFFNSDYMNNVDIIGFLEEMGFNLEFFVYDNFSDYIVKNEYSYKLEDGNHEIIENFVNKKIKNKDKFNLNFFSNESEFNELLEKSELDLVYSDLYFDNRLVNTGLNQFSLKNFYVGYEGALKTIKELKSLCEMTFYKTYNKYFDN